MENGFPKHLAFLICCALSCVPIIGPPAKADSFPSIDLNECPVHQVIRLSDPTMASKFQALKDCAVKMGDRENTFSPDPPPVARIIGVTEQKIREIEEERDKYEVERAKRISVLQPASFSPAFDREIRQTALQHNIDPLFLHAIVETESHYRPTAVSRAGARGLMQIMPGTGAELGLDEAAFFDPARNIDAGARHLKTLQRRFGSNLELILGAYNAGAGAVVRYGNRVPPYAETVDYISKVMRRYRTLISFGGGSR